MSRTPTARLALYGLLVCVAVGVWLILRLWHDRADPTVMWLFIDATLAGLLGVIGVRAIGADQRKTAALAQTVAVEREHKASLQQSVVEQSSELEDAQRVLQRMWWLGQQITLELDPERVVSRFLEAVVDVVQADGAVVGLLGDDGNVRMLVGTGIGTPLSGASVALSSSTLGRVISTGTPCVHADVAAHPEALAPELPAQLVGVVRSMAAIPISRRGERIGGVAILSKERREFSAVDLERIETMGDLLSLSLENAELVETLRQAEWRFRTLFRAAPDAVFTVFKTARIREANDAVREVTGIDSAQLVGRAVTDLVIESDRVRLAGALDAAFDGVATRIEVIFLRANETGDPSRRIVELAMSRLPEAEPPSVLLVGRDMTSEREMRLRLMESDRLAAVGELVAGVAHEVNNPLSSISAFAQLLLRDGGLTPCQRESIEVIRSETMRASQVVKDLLAFARRSEVIREPVDVNLVLSRTLRLRGYQLTSNRIELETDFSSELPPVVGDARQLQQVCLNLVTNAVQAMSAKGGGKLVVSSRRVGDSVVIEVRDTGPGIPDSARAHIFEPFFTTKGEGEGTGLGLSVSYGIVTAHGGTIEVADTSPAGTTFRVTLPAVVERASDDDTTSATPAARRSPLAGIRLLFIEDEASLRSGMQAFGRLRGFTVLTAENGLRALEMVRASPVDAIVCDLRMPGLDGPAFHEALRRERPGLAARTMFITGDVVAIGGRIAGIKQPVLAKPFTFEKLEETLVALMRGTSVATPVGWP